MTFISRGAVLVAGALSTASLLGGTPAIAASSATKAFLANVTPNVDFLDRSSRFALTNSKSTRMRAFAFSEAAEQTLAANALYDHSLAETNPLVASADSGKLDRTPTGSTKAASPKAVNPRAGGAKPSVTPMPAPVAAPVPTSKAAPDTIADDRLPMGQEELDSLEGLEGSVFDAQYTEKQLDALHQLETDYQDYAVKGDDLALRAFAVRELPKVKRRIAQLGKI